MGNLPVGPNWQIVNDLIHCAIEAIEVPTWSKNDAKQRLNNV